MSEHKCACESEKLNWGGYWYMIGVYTIGLLIMASLLSSEIHKQEAEVRKQSKQIAILWEYSFAAKDNQEGLTRAMFTVSTILSNQTQMLIALKKIADIQMMSSGSPSNINIDLPAMEEMLPSKTNGIDLSGIDLLEPTLLHSLEDHPWPFIPFIF